MADKKPAAGPAVFKTWRDLSPLNASVGDTRHNITGSWRFIRPFYEDKTPACQNACPAGNDIEGFIRLFGAEDHQAAYQRLKIEEPFPAILGRVCFHFCQDHCNRNALDESVRIRDIERFLGKMGDPTAPPPGLPPADGPKLAIVGSGPAGMSAAYFARRMGFRPSIYEAADRPGGMLRFGIPAYRLPREVLDAEFAGLAGMGVSIRTSMAVGRDVSLKRLQKDHDYVFLATGAWKSFRLMLPGEEKSPYIQSGLRFLQRVSSGERVKPGGWTVVIGGGDTAIDAARTALRLGSGVTVVYRRTEAEMPAHAEEVAEARAEGVKFVFLAGLKTAELAEDGAIRRLVFHEMALGEPDQSGRRRPQVKEGAEFDMEASLLLTAIGEGPDLDYLEDPELAHADQIPVDPTTLRAAGRGWEGARIYAGGDVVDQPRTVVHALAAGKRAAMAMDCDRRGLDARRALSECAIGTGPGLSFAKYMNWPHVSPVKVDLKTVVDAEHMVLDYFFKQGPTEIPETPPDQRRQDFAPYRRGFKPPEAASEADRCLHCGRCIECDNCLIFCPEVSVHPKKEAGFGYEINYDYCKGCGICFTECPRQAMTLIEEQAAGEQED